MEIGSAYPKISVVVPIYNIEKYIDRCVKSILRQTYSNTEIILVNDGSTDESPAICDRYRQSAANVQVLHQENQGLSAARNAGTAAATGEYIAFVDGDDYIGENFLSVRASPGGRRQFIPPRKLCRLCSIKRSSMSAPAESYIP